jgi:anaerobic ribonucleoside-triphosphate reductase activating protein
MLCIHGQLESSTTNGPGNRAVIWLSGCNLGCPGCWNPDSHKHGAGIYRSIEHLGNWLEGIPNIDGITFSGGEPIQQIPDLLNLIRSIHSRNSKFSIGMFTGYRLEELEQGRFEYYSSLTGLMYKGGKFLWSQVAEHLDFAVMGRYNQKLKTSSLPLCGSSNQKLILFSPRYNKSDFKKQQAQIIISSDGKLVTLTGFPSPGVEAYASQTFNQEHKELGSCKEEESSNGNPFKCEDC